MDFVSGEIIAVDKPLHWTSFDAVKRLRGALQRRLGVRKFKVGHAGTLDPLATGVLIVCTGRATRSIDTLQAGHIAQVPPVYSAVKIDGKRAYKFARRGQEVELKAKPLEIKELEVEEMDLSGAEPWVRLRIVCGKGTYIRALARDIGRELGSGAHLTALRRTRVGQYPIDRCLSLDQALELIERVDITFPDDYTPPKAN